MLLHSSFKRVSQNQLKKMLILSRLKKFKKNYNKDIGFTFGEIWVFFCCNNMALLISFSADFFLSKKKIRKKKDFGKAILLQN